MLLEFFGLMVFIAIGLACIGTPITSTYFRIRFGVFKFDGEFVFDLIFLLAGVVCLWYVYDKLNISINLLS